MANKKALSVLTGAGLAGAASLAAYVFAIRRWHLRWGASDEEINRKMPGDDFISDPSYITNRAITIKAHPEEIWPWLAQMGEGRGGFYTYDWIDRMLGLKVSSATNILPEFQNLEVGDTLDINANMIVKDIEANRHLVIGTPENAPWGESTWSMVLYPMQDGRTRLVSRVRARLTRSPQAMFWGLLLDPGQFIMERRWLIGIKRRVEKSVKEHEAQLISGLETDKIRTESENQ